MASRSGPRWASAWGLVALGLLFAVSAGCTTGPGQWLRNGLKVGPNYGRPPAPVGDQWIDTGNPRLKLESDDNGYWWYVFNDPILNDLVCTAYRQNLPLKIAGMRVLEARAQLGVTTGNLFAQSQAMSGRYSRGEMSEKSYPFGEFPLSMRPFDTWSLGFDAAWELDFWGQFRRMVESAEAGMDARIEDYDDALVILQAEVAATYIQLRTLEERLALARRNVDLQERTVQIVQDRADNGLVSELDVQQALANLATTESLIPLLETSHRQAQNRLCTLMGMPPQDLAVMLAGPGRIPSAPAEVAVGIPAELLRRRPDVRRAEREAAAQCAQIGVAESDFYPHISITGSIAFEAEQLANLWDWDSIAASTGPSFRWNILNYGRIRNNVRVQDARFRQLVLGYQEAVLRANEEAESAVTAYLREHVRIESLRQSTQATARAVELADIQYKEGLIDFQRVLDSQRALVQQQDTLAESYGNVALNLIAVYKALGGGWRMRCQPNPPTPTVAGEPTPANGGLRDAERPILAPPPLPSPLPPPLPIDASPVEVP